MIRTGSIIVIMVLLTFFTIYLLGVEEINVNDDSELIKPKIPSNASQIINAENTAYKEQADEKLKQKKPQVNEFSDNNYINTRVVQVVYWECMKYFKSLAKKDIHIWLDSIKDKHKYAEALKQIDECETVNINHPEYNLTNEKEFGRLDFTLPSTSLLEKYLRNEIYAGNNMMQDKQFLRELYQENPIVLLIPSSYYAVTDFLMAYSAGEMMKLVKTQSIGYLFELQHHAMMVFNCSHNNDCKDSFVLSFLCNSQKKYCNIDSYSAYIKQEFSRGQQADIAIVVKYLGNLFLDVQSP